VAAFENWLKLRDETRLVYTCGPVWLLVYGGHKNNEIFMIDTSCFNKLMILSSDQLKLLNNTSLSKYFGVWWPEQGYTNPLILRTLLDGDRTSILFTRYLNLPQSGVLIIDFARLGSERRLFTTCRSIWCRPSHDRFLATFAQTVDGARNSKADATETVVAAVVAENKSQCKFSLLNLPYQY
jgi:hypothetical protein